MIEIIHVSYLTIMQQDLKLTIISSKCIHSRRFKNPLLNDEWVKEKIHKEKEILELNENEYTTQQNLKSILRGKFIFLSGYI